MRKKSSLILILLLLISCLAGCGKQAAEDEPITSLEQLDDKKYTVGLAMGTTAEHDAEAYFKNAKLEVCSSAQDAYLAVSKGMLDAFAFSRANMECALASGSLQNVTLLEENVGEGTDVVIGLSRKSEIPDLEVRVNAFVGAIRADGTLDDAYDRWVVKGLETMPDIPQPEHPDCRIVVGTAGCVEPFNYYKGPELTGMDIELIRYFAGYMNAEIELVVLDFPALTAAAEAGTLDCIFSNLNATPERAEVMNFSDPLYSLPTAIMVRTGEAGSAPTEAAPVSLSDFDGKKIGVLTGSVHDAYVKQHLPHAEPQYFSNVSDQATALVSGALDAFSIDVLTARALMAENDKVTYIEEPLGYIDTAYAFAKGPDGEALCRQMNDFLAKLTADGTMAELEEKWLSTGAGDYDTDLSGLTGHDRTLTFATSCSGKPNAYYYNNAPTGFEVEIAAMFCREYGYNLDIQVTDFSSIIPGISTGKYDFGADGIMITEERAQSVNFSDPDYHCSIVIVCRNDIGAQTPAAGSLVPHFSSLSEMKNSNISLGIEVGSYFEEITKSEFPNAELMYYDTVSDIANSIAAGKLDGFIVDEPVARLICSNSPKLTCIEEPLETNSYAAVFPKTPEGEALCGEVSEFIRQCKADGTLDQVINAWLTDDIAAQRTDYASLSGENGTVRMAASFEAPPFGFFREGDCVGMDLDLMIRFCEARGYALEVTVTNFTAVIPSLGTTCDIGVDGFCITPERAEEVLFSEPYYIGGTLMVVGTEKASAAEEDLSFWQSLSASFEKTFIREQRWKLIAQGIGTTVFISFFSALFGTLLGFGICLLRRMRSKTVFGITTVYIRILQGTPLVVLLMVFYYLVFPKSGLRGEWVAVIAFTLNFAAYVSEMMRTGIEAVDVGQTEAALALGFTKSRAFFKFILPQAAQHFLPVYKGEFISLVKMTSIVGYIAVQDLTKMSDIIRSRTYEAFFPLIATALIYFLISWLLSVLLRLVEIRTEPDRKNRTVKGVNMQ